jgi:hypothetical protein
MRELAPLGEEKLTDAKQPSGNQNYSWSQFDSEAYFQHYYGDPHPDDDKVIAQAAAAFKHAQPKGAKLSIVDVGTGPNLFPLFVALPRASRITAWEYATSNVAWLKAELASDVLRPQWRHFWQVTRDAYGPDFGLPENPIPLLREKAEIRNGSVYELPERQWDAATMFFCAESITEKFSEFELACVRFAKCVRPGGALIAAFLVGSSGYEVAARPFPVLNVSEKDILQVFSLVSVNWRTQSIGIVEREIRSGYSGFVFLTAEAL